MTRLAVHADIRIQIRLLEYRNGNQTRTFDRTIVNQEAFDALRRAIQQVLVVPPRTSKPHRHYLAVQR